MANARQVPEGIAITIGRHEAVVAHGEAEKLAYKIMQELDAAGAARDKAHQDAVEAARAALTPEQKEAAAKATAEKKARLAGGSAPTTPPEA